MKQLMTLILMLPMACAFAEPMGRLFYTPAQRAMLDNARKQNIKIDVESETPTLDTISVNGVVKRSDGESIVWINNKPVSNKSPNDIKITPRSGDNSRVILQLPPSGRSVDLRVGQKLDTVSGQIVEGYQQAAPAIEQKTAIPTGTSAVATPVPEQEKPKSAISRKADDEVVAEPPTQTNEQPQSAPPQQPAQTQY
jgi:hypothetical protein